MNTKTEKPILFNTEMVQAILEGRKSKTRRILKRPFIEVNGDSCSLRETEEDDICFGANWKECLNVIIGDYAPYKPGDILYVRETWAEMPYGYVYRADGEEPEGWDPDDRWRPSIHMPKEAARIFLRVKNVEVERLQDSFSHTEAAVLEFQAEGIELPEDPCLECIEQYGEPCCSDLDTSLPFDESDGTDAEEGSECGWLDEVKGDFSRLWDATIKQEKYGWSENPWVWVITFELLQKGVNL